MNSKLIVSRANSETKIPDPQILFDEKTLLPQLVSRRVLEQRFIIPISKIIPFYTNLARGRLVATKCKRCGSLYFPPRGDCSKCHSTMMLTKTLSHEARLLSFTKIFVKPSSFSQFPDYTVGVARLKDGVNVLCWIRGIAMEDISVGMKVVLKVERRPEDGALEYYITC
jgi:uncharacterized OB-fold protein